MKTEKEIIQALKKDINDFKALPENLKFTTIGNPGILTVNDTDKLFLIQFYIENFNPQDTILKYAALDFGSDDNGKTWKLNNDTWANYFVYNLCRRKKNYR